MSFAPRWVAPLLGALLLAACGSAAPPRFHSLLGAPLKAAAPALAWQLGAVSIPAQVDQPQFVLRRADGSYALLEQERWVAPLQDELRESLAEQLASRLGPSGQPPATGHADWRVGVDLQRFDAAPGRATLVAQWRVQGGSVALRCTVRLEQAVADGVPALAAGQRQNVQALGSALAAALTELDAGRMPACPG